MKNHIKNNYTENDSWCGESLGNEFYFKDLEHLVLTGSLDDANKPEVFVCVHCINKIIKYLNSVPQKYPDECCG